MATRMTPVSQMARRFISRNVFATYAVRINSIAVSGGTGSGTITIDNDAPFIWSMSTYVANITGAAVTDATRVLPLTNVQMSTQDTQRMNNIAVPIPSIFGTADKPFVLPRKRVLATSTKITFDVTNLDSTNVIASLWLVLVGEKAFDEVA